MDKFTLYIDGIPLKEFPVTQNEVGKYYYNGSSYYKPTLDKFDNATPPKGYKTYYNGSHLPYKNNPLRNPIDFSIYAGKKITASHNVKMDKTESGGGSWCAIFTPGDGRVALVHTYKWAKKGTTVKAGDTICVVAPYSVTKLPAHLHTDEWTGKSIRNLILYGTFEIMSKVKAGKKYQFNNTNKLNVRDVPNGKQVLLQLKAGAKCVGKAMTDGVKAGNYTWNLYQGDGWAGYIAENWSEETSREVTDKDGKTNSSGDCSVCEKKLADANKTIVEQNKELKAKNEAIEELEEDVKEYKKYHTFYYGLTKYINLKPIPNED